MRLCEWTSENVPQEKLIYGKSASREVIKAAIDAGWELVPTRPRAHAWGKLVCPAGKHRQSIWSTPKSAENHAKDLRRAIDRCTHTRPTDDDV